MIEHLDNPFFHALRTEHSSLAVRSGLDVWRYPKAFAPFVGVAHAGICFGPEHDSLIEPEENVFLLGVAPKVSPHWQVEAFRPLAQMICEHPIESMPIESKSVESKQGPEIVVLGASHREQVLALTALVYPHYFRLRTMELGRYFGIFLGGRLAAMIGERITLPECTEISAVCTHPDFLGQGLAQRLMAHLHNDLLAKNRLPFLHVSHENTRAKFLYERLGYRLRVDIPFWCLKRSEIAFQ